MKRKMNLTEALGNEWKSHFSKGSTITELLDTLGMADQTFKEIVASYTINDDRLAVLVNTMSIKDAHLARILIDFKCGELTYEQLVEDTFTIGADCDMRVVIIDGGRDSENVQDFDYSSEDLWMGDSFVKLLNHHGISTYLVEALKETDKENHARIQYYTIRKPDPERMCPGKALPSKRKFEEASFWVVYSAVLSPFNMDSPPLLAEPHYWIDYGEEFYCEERLKLIPTWNDDGFSIQITRAPFEEADSRLLKRIWKENEKLIGDKFKDKQLVVKDKRNAGMELTVRMTDKPFRDFILSSAQEKYELARMFHDTVNDIRNFFIEIMERMHLLNY